MMKDRINTLIKAMNFTATQFAEEIGVQKSGISHILSGRNNPSLDFVQKILQRFPDVNMEWLIMGKGSMITGDVARIAQSEPRIPEASGGVNQPLDLFSPQLSPVFEVEPRATIAKQQVAEREDTILPEKETDREKVSQLRPEGIKEEVSPHYGERKKRIERIIVFYSDRTFLEYSPGN